MGHFTIHVRLSSIALAVKISKRPENRRHNTAKTG